MLSARASSPAADRELMARAAAADERAMTELYDR
jgi:hypothetical protein